MPAKRSFDSPKSANKIRFVMLEADLSDGNLLEITQAITSALKPVNQIRYVTTAQPPSLPQANDDVLGDEGEPNASESEDSTDEVFPAPVRAPRGSGKPRKLKAPEYLPDLIREREAFKEFAKQKAPKSRTKQYLVAAYWLKEHASSPTVNIDKIYTCFKTAGWSVGFNNWRASFDHLIHSEHIRIVNPGEFAINPLGEDLVNADKE